jgi:N-methylhydantoinase A/oxoprolinase/acetone carboxylase beta subunit
MPGHAASGPAVITGAEATAVVPPGFRFRIDGFGNIVARLRHEPASARLRK